jgi:hypothetical protein
MLINNVVTRFHFKIIITMLFSYGYGDNGINDDKKWRQINNNIDCHTAGAIRRDAHCPMERIRGFMQSHLMPPSGKCPRRIAPVAAMVNDFEKNKKH